MTWGPTWGDAERLFRAPLSQCRMVGREVPSASGSSPEMVGSDTWRHGASVSTSLRVPIPSEDTVMSPSAGRVTVSD